MYGLIGAMVLTPAGAQVRSAAQVEFIVQSIKAQVYGGRPEALEQLKSLPPETALLALQPYLSVSHSEDPKIRTTAIEVIRGLNLEFIYEKRLNEESVQRSAGVDILLGNR